MLGNKESSTHTLNTGCFQERIWAWFYNRHQTDWGPYGKNDL